MQSTSSSRWGALVVAGLVVACSGNSDNGRSNGPDSVSFVGGDSTGAEDTGRGIADRAGPDSIEADSEPGGPDDTREGPPDQIPDTATAPPDVKDAAHVDEPGSETPPDDTGTTGPDDTGLPQDAVTPPPEDTVEPTPDLPGAACEYCGPDQVCTNGTCVPACTGSCSCVPGPEDCPDPPGGGQIPGAVTPDVFAAFVAAKGQSEHWGACTGGDELACHLFVRQVIRTLYEQDPNWGLLTKVPGQSQCTFTACGSDVSCGYATDAIIYRATNQVIDVITGIGAPGSSVAWQLVPKLDYNHWAPPPCMPGGTDPKPTGMLASGKSLAAGEAVVSSDERFRLEYQADGDLVLTYVGFGVLWSTGTKSAPGSASMQGDGNLVVYDAGGTPLWASDTGGNPGAWLALQNDGNAVIYTAGGASIWATGTCCY